MGNKLIIAEKPMLGRDIASAICGKSGKFPITGNGYTVVACAGHLLELEEPERINKKWGQPWTLSSLPIDPRPWRKKVASGKRELVNLIKAELKKCDSVINAGDPDDEGQLIIDEVLDFLGYKGKVERVYVNDSIEKNIKKAFKALKDNDSCRGAGNGALARQYADFTFGANESRLACLKCGQNVAVGRVQTPTLGLVVNRDRTIENHEVRKFFELYVDAGVGDKVDPCGLVPKSAPLVDFKFIPVKELTEDGKHIFDKSMLKEQIAGQIPIMFSETTKISQETKNPPLPFNLTKLQSACSKRFGFSAKKTLDITQALRDKYKAITYNRTDCQYLSEEHFKDAKNVVVKVIKNLGIGMDGLDLSRHHSAFNDKNISAHHAIIPQEINVNIDKMTRDEANVYKMICQQYLQLFMEPKVSSVSTTVLEIVSSGMKKLGDCKYIAKKTINPGWTSKYGEEKKDEAEGKYFIDRGQHMFEVRNTRLIEKETNPPKPYTEGTLIADMASIAKYCKSKKIKEILKKKDEDKKGEHGGIGTTATRGSIIENLKKRGFLENNGKKIVSTEKGRSFFDLIPDNIKGADVTALWWLMQEDVAKAGDDVYKVADHVIKVFNEHKDSAYAGASLASSGNKKKVGKCPVCGSDVVATGSIYQCCSNKSEKQSDGSWKDVAGCGFKMFGKVAGKKLTQKQISDLCDGRTITAKGLKSKAGKKFDCGLKLKDSPERGFYGTDFVFDVRVP